MEPKLFSPRPHSFNEIKKKILFRIGPVLILAIAVGFLIAHTNTDHTRADDFNVLPFMIPIGGLLIFYSIYKTLGKQKELFESYTLQIDDTSISREQKGMPTITLSKWEIREINKQPDGGLIIKGANTLDNIHVPAQLQDLSEAEKLLNQFSPITSHPTSLAKKYSFVLSILSLGLLAAVFLLKDRIWITLSGILMTGLLIWTLYVGLKSKNVDKKTKQGLLWIGVVLIAIIFRVVLVWFNK